MSADVYFGLPVGLLLIRVLKVDLNFYSGWIDDRELGVCKLEDVLYFFKDCECNDVMQCIFFLV